MKFNSNKEDVLRISRLLNNELKNKFIIDYSFRNYNNAISGTYRDENTNKIVRVVISYNKNYFLKILVISTDNELRKRVLNILESVLEFSNDEDRYIGKPVAYYLPENESLNPYVAWSFKDTSDFINYLKGNILYNEGNLDNLFLLENNNKKLTKIKVG